MPTNNKRLMVVTGLSGSGKSIALHALEDVGYYCIDNLPASLLEVFGDELLADTSGTYDKAAIGIDVRNPSNNLQQVPSLVKRLRELGIRCEILFLDAQNDVLIQRYSETRRRHPLTNNSRSLEQAIRLERTLLESLGSDADLRLDTTRKTLHELRAVIHDRIARRSATELSIEIESFGFKHGLPRNADFVFDARCLPNPYWEPELRPYTGRDEPVVQFLGTDATVERMYSQIAAFLDEWIPSFVAGGRSYLTVAIGCTGGQHRSVYLAERLTEALRSKGHRSLVSHRELS